jgi:hypothetical protein
MRAGKWELWEKSLIDGREAPVISDDHVRDFPQWSPDGCISPMPGATSLIRGRRKSWFGPARIAVKNL